MNWRKTALFLLATIMLCSMVLAGCGKSAEDEATELNDTSVEEVAQELHLLLNDEPLLDPQRTQYIYEFTVVCNLMEGLLRIGENQEMLPGVAETWTASEDGLTWTFQLRDAKWSDGSAVTANDFVYAWNRALSPEVASTYKAMIDDHIKQAEAVDEKTLKVTLKSPAPYFESLMAFSTFLPAKEAFVEPLGASYGTDKDKLLYNGPFMIKEWNHNNRLELVKNENYWDADQVRLDKISLDIIKDENAALSLYEEGSLDVTNLAREQVPLYEEDPEFHLLSQPTITWLVYSTLNPVLENMNIRKAFSYGFDRESYIHVILNNGATVATGLIPTGIPGPGGESFRDCNGDLVTYDPKKAKQYLEAGLKELGLEQLPPLTFMGYDSTVGIKGAEFVKENYKQLGIEIVVENIPVPAVKERLINGDFDLFLGGWGPDYWDAMTYMDVFLSDSPVNDGRWSNDEYDQLIRAAAEEGDAEKRLEAMVRAEQILIVEDPAIAPIFFKSIAYLEKPHVKGLVRHPFGAEQSWKWTYIEE